MRKFTLLIASLFFTIGAMAQITAVSELSNTKCYQIKSIDAARGVFYAATGAEYLSTCGGTHANYPNQDVAIDTSDKRQQFALVSYDSKLYLYSVSEKKFANRTSDGYIKLTWYPSDYVTVEINDGVLTIEVNDANKLNLAWPTDALAGVNANYDTADDGNKLVITEVGEFDPAEALKAFTYSTPTVGKYYYIKGLNTTSPWLTASTGTDNAIVVSGSQADAGIFLRTTNGLQAVSTEKYFGLNGDVISLVDAEATVTLDANSDGNMYAIKVGGKYLHNNATDITHEGGLSATSQNYFGFIEVPYFVPGTEEITYILTDEAGNEYSGVYNGIPETDLPMFSGASGYSLVDGTWDGTNYSATINFPYPVSKVGGATNETLLDINSTGKYIRNENDNVKVSNATADANCLWAIYPSFSEGAFTFEIMNIATGKYLYTEATSAVHDTEGTVVLNNVSTKFTVISDKDFKVADKSLYLSINSPSGDNGVYLGVYGNVHSGTNVNAVDLPQYNVAISDAGHATFYAPVAVNIPTNVKAYTVTINNSNWATLNEITTGVIPAYTGVVLVADTNTYTFTVVATDADAIEGNLLKGTVAAAIADEDVYVLANVNGNVGLYKADRSSDFTLKHHGAYLPATAVPAAAASSNGFRFDFSDGTTTEIDEVKTENGNVKTVYDLQGRIVENPTAGIYIVNGKKVLVK